MLTRQAIAFIALGKAWKNSIVSFAESFPISDSEVIQDVLDLLDERIGGAEEIYNLVLSGDRLSGLVNQRLSFLRTQLFEFDITGDRMRYKLAPGSPEFGEAESDEEWLDAVEYAAKTKKKPKCKPGNVDCGQKCQSAKLNCFHGMSPEQKKKAQAAIRKAKAAVKKAQAAGAIASVTSAADDRSNVREEFRPFFDMATGGNPDDVAIDAKALTAARSIMYDGIDNFKVERIRTNHPDLTEDEAEGLSTWLGEKGCNVMNKRLYAPNTPDPDNGMLAVDMLAAKALHKIPPVTEAQATSLAQKLGSNFDPNKPLEKFFSFPVKGDLDRFVKKFKSNVGKEYREETFFGVTHDRKGVGWIESDANLMIKIKPKLDGTGSGRYVDHFKNKMVEAEILYPPQTKFRVVSVTPPKTLSPQQIDKKLKQQFSEEELSQAQTAKHLEYAIDLAEATGQEWKTVYKKLFKQEPPKTKMQASKLIKLGENVKKAKIDLQKGQGQAIGVIELEEI